MNYKVDLTRLTKLSAATLLSLQLMACSSIAKMQSKEQIWATTWATATEDIREGFWMSKGHFPPKPLSNDTVRLFTRTSIAGDVVRVKFSNAFGKSPVTLQAVHLAMAEKPNSSETNGRIKPETDTALKFDGQLSVILQPGETLYSDPIDFNLPPLSTVAVSIHYGDIDEKPITGHRGARTTSFFATGNAVSDVAMDGAVKKDVWYTMTGIEVKASAKSKVIVAMGDSITDGYGTQYNHHTRWTDYLAERLSKNKATANVGVANVGIGGSSSGMGVQRFQRDVLDLSAAHWVVIFIGVNDIVYGQTPSATKIIDSYKAMALKAREKGLKVYGATITPMGGKATPEKESIRELVNTWVRTTAITEGYYDDVIDFDLAARNPQNPTYLLPAYAVDDLHLNITGYQALADFIDLRLFTAGIAAQRP
jgi:lysophospholipase L1-like esterase